MKHFTKVALMGILSTQVGFIMNAEGCLGPLDMGTITITDANRGERYSHLEGTARTCFAELEQTLANKRRESFNKLMNSVTESVQNAVQTMALSDEDKFEDYVRKSNALMAATNQICILKEASAMCMNEAELAAFTERENRKIFDLLEKSDLRDLHIDRKILAHSTQEDQELYALSCSFIQLMRLCQDMPAQKFLTEYKIWSNCILGQIYVEEFQSNMHHIKGLFNVPNLDKAEEGESDSDNPSSSQRRSKL